MRLKEMTALFGPSGFEDAVRDALKKEAEEALGARDGRVFTDALGNLYALREGEDEGRPHVMLCAHMDEAGLIVRYATQEGLLRFDRVGPVDLRALATARVRVGADGLPGVIGCKAAHLMSEEEENRAPACDALSIDIGASGREEAERLCPKGSYAAFDSPYVEFGDGFAKAKAIASRACCLILLEILRESGYAGRMTCVFTVQKKAGLRGATVAARRVRPDMAVVLGETAANDMGNVKPHLRGAACGGGVSVVTMDGGMIANRALVQEAMRVAGERGIPAQLQRANEEWTDAAAIHLAGAGVPCLSLNIPCRYVNSPACVVKLADIDAAKRLALGVLDMR